MAKKSQPPSNRQVAIGNDNIQVIGSNNVITKIKNFFASETETVEQRNRRIMLGHVENFWVKGILEKSLHGAALLELGIREDPDALNYPWAIKREATSETLPLSMSMLEIFHEIGMGRSLLILGSPGSGKTTMLLELTRQLIKCAREDATEPIPVVFNLASWNEKFSLSDWIASELNAIYTIPKKIAPTWVKENRMLLLLDGLDEVKREYRGKCVDAINQFRRENGLTSLAVCSRSQDYAELKTRLSLDGAIEIQPLTSNQVDEYFKGLGNGLAGIRKTLEKDSALHEMAETPLFLSIMLFAYQGINSKDVLISKNMEEQRLHLFKAYIDRMFERLGRTNTEPIERKKVLGLLSWLSHKMIEQNAVPFLIENIQPKWLSGRGQEWQYRYFITFFVCIFIGGIFGGVLGWITGWILGYLITGIIGGTALSFLWLLFSTTCQLLYQVLKNKLIPLYTRWETRRLGRGAIVGVFSGPLFCLFVGFLLWWISIVYIVFNYMKIYGLVSGLPLGLAIGYLSGIYAGLYTGIVSLPLFVLMFGAMGIIFTIRPSELISFFDDFEFNQELGDIQFVDTLKLSWKRTLMPEPRFSFLRRLTNPKYIQSEVPINVNLMPDTFYFALIIALVASVIGGIVFGVVIGLGIGLLSALTNWLVNQPISQTTFPGQRISLSLWNFIYILLITTLIAGISILSINWLLGQNLNPLLGLLIGLVVGLNYGGYPVIQHYILRFLITRNNHLPWNLVPLLNYCADLIFLRQVGGGYIFVHRLLMEHFAAMYTGEEN
jgi:eukaryotic-like serine/threonine-protein kinase